MNCISRFIGWIDMCCLNACQHISGKVYRIFGVDNFLLAQFVAGIAIVLVEYHYIMAIYTFDNLFVRTTHIPCSLYFPFYFYVFWKNCQKLHEKYKGGSEYAHNPSPIVIIARITLLTITFSFLVIMTWRSTTWGIVYTIKVSWSFGMGLAACACAAYFYSCTPPPPKKSVIGKLVEKVKKIFSPRQPVPERC